MSSGNISNPSTNNSGILLLREILTTIAQALPSISLAELKVIFMALFKFFTTGGSAQITFTEFQQSTGLSRDAVSRGIKAAIKHGLIRRHKITGYQGHTSYLYAIPSIQSPFDFHRSENKTDEALIKQSKAKSFIFNPDYLSLSLLDKESSLLALSTLAQKLRNLGVYPKTARFLVNNYPPERISQFLKIYPIAFRVGRADGPGWLVSAIQDPTWDPAAEAEDLSVRESNFKSQEEKAHHKYVEGEFAEYIN